MKLLYLVKRPLAKRDWDRYGIGFMLEHGHEVTVFDLSNVLHPDLPSDQDDDLKNKGADICALKNWAHLKEKKSAFAETDLVIFLIQSYGLSRNTYRLLKIMAKHSTPYLIISPALYPGFQTNVGQGTKAKYTKDLWARLYTMDPLNSLISRLPPRLARHSKGCIRRIYVQVRTVFK